MDPCGVSAAVAALQGGGNVAEQVAAMFAQFAVKLADMSTKMEQMQKDIAAVTVQRNSVFASLFDDGESSSLIDSLLQQEQQQQSFGFSSTTTQMSVSSSSNSDPSQEQHEAPSEGDLLLFQSLFNMK